jgi:hypothetical protein
MNNYVIAAYAIGSILLWGFAVSMWFESRAIAARARVHDGKADGGRS